MFINYVPANLHRTKAIFQMYDRKLPTSNGDSSGGGDTDTRRRNGNLGGDAQRNTIRKLPRRVNATFAKSFATHTFDLAFSNSIIHNN
jgi:hypothetical protein